MPPIPTTQSAEQNSLDESVSPRFSSDNLSVSSVTRKISAILKNECGSSTTTEQSENDFIPSSKNLFIYL